MENDFQWKRTTMSILRRCQEQLSNTKEYWNWPGIATSGDFDRRLQQTILSRFARSLRQNNVEGTPFQYPDSTGTKPFPFDGLV